MKLEVHEIAKKILIANDNYIKDNEDAEELEITQYDSGSGELLIRLDFFNVIYSTPIEFMRGFIHE